MLSMTTYNELLDRWNLCQGGQILVDHLHPIQLYLNINENNHRELLIPTDKPIMKFQSTVAIGIRNYKSSNRCYFAIELLSEYLIKEYACLCFDLIESSRCFSSTHESLLNLFVTFEKWYTLMASVRLDILPISEIRGLMGELKFILDEITRGECESHVIEAWTIRKDASRDFIFDNSWSEIKTIQSSGDYVSISSLEQLDHDIDGHLVVYRLDRVDQEGAENYSLNGMVEEIRNKLSIHVETELNKKLLAKGYSTNELYDNYVFRFGNKSSFIVSDSFPRINKGSLSSAICAARYDILLNQLEDWRENNEQ